MPAAIDRRISMLRHGIRSLSRRILQAENDLLAVFIGRVEQTCIVGIDDIFAQVNDLFKGSGSFGETFLTQVSTSQKCQRGLFCSAADFGTCKRFLAGQISCGSSELVDHKLDNSCFCRFFDMIGFVRCKGFGNQRHRSPVLGHIKILCRAQEAGFWQ